MRLSVDPQVCQGHTLCAMNAPDLFELDEADGHARVLVDTIPAPSERAARLAVAACPERAIRIVD